MSRTLLVIDHRATMCAIIARVAEREGFTVRCVTDPCEAVAAFAQAQPDLVILDMVLPGLTGFQMLRELLDTGRTTRFVLMTADGIGDAYLGIAQGVARYHGMAALPVLFKPFRQAQLVELLEQVPEV